MTTETIWATAQLAEVLQKQGRMARWLAREIGVSESLLSRVLSGQRGLRIDKAELVCRMLGVEMADVCERSGRKEGGAA
jgi:DNA-binding Xre family transcriptional regulator